MLRGIDISSYQNPSNIDYFKLSTQIEFAILRAGYTGWGGEGTNLYIDSAFERHYAQFLKLGIPMGVYWYSCANTEEKAIKEANYLLSLIKDKKFDWPIFIDTEDNHHQLITPKNQLTDSIIAFMETIKASGLTTGYYCSTYWKRDQLDSDRLKSYISWQADYRSGIELTEKECSIWQYSSSGELDGYNDRLDLNTSFINFKKVTMNQNTNTYRFSRFAKKMWKWILNGEV